MREPASTARRTDAMQGPACDNCGARRALVRLTTSGRTRLLCDDCFAEAASTSADRPLDLARFFYLLARPSSDADPATYNSMPADTRCPECGTAYEDLKRFGLLGCAACYEAFAPAVAQALWTLQGVAVSSDRAS